MSDADVDALLDVQEPAAVAGLSHIFPQDRYPFPRAAVAARWREEIADPTVNAYLCTADDGSVEGFAAVKARELLHFGTALPTWGSGLAPRFHDAVLAATIERLGPTTLTLRVFEENRRARRFYERRGWQPTGRRSRTASPPHPVLLEYERRTCQSA